MKKINLKKLKNQLNEVDYVEVKIPGNLERFLDTFTETVKKIKLNKNQQISILYKIFKGLDIFSEEFTYGYRKIKDLEGYFKYSLTNSLPE